MPSIRLHNGPDYFNYDARLFIRCTEVFILTEDSDSAVVDPPDPMSAAAVVAKAVCAATKRHLSAFREKMGVTKFAVRVLLDPEQVSYSVSRTYR